MAIGGAYRYGTNGKAVLDAATNDLCTTSRIDVVTNAARGREAKRGSVRSYFLVYNLDLLDFGVVLTSLRIRVRNIPILTAASDDRGSLLLLGIDNAAGEIQFIPHDHVEAVRGLGWDQKDYSFDKMIEGFRPYLTSIQPTVLIMQDCVEQLIQRIKGRQKRGVNNNGTKFPQGIKCPIDPCEEVYKDPKTMTTHFTSGFCPNVGIAERREERKSKKLRTEAPTTATATATAPTTASTEPARAVPAAPKAEGRRNALRKRKTAAAPASPIDVVGPLGALPLDLAQNMDILIDIEDSDLEDSELETPALESVKLWAASVGLPFNPNLT